MSISTINSEYARIKSVIIYLPEKDIFNFENVKYFGFKDKLNYQNLKIEISLLIEFFKKINIDVKILKSESQSYPNLIYCRDLFFSTPNGPLISKMSQESRVNEPEILVNYFKTNNIKMIDNIEVSNCFEGADILWLNKSNILIGVGDRTNIKAAKDISTNLLKYNINTTIVDKIHNQTQHLLGICQFISNNQVLVRTKLASTSLLNALTKFKYNIIEIPENDEVINKYAMNIVVIEKNTIIMPTNCPYMKQFYLNHKIKVLKELDITELGKGGGGLACCVGILERYLI